MYSSKIKLNVLFCKYWRCNILWINITGKKLTQIPNWKKILQKKRIFSEPQKFLFNKVLFFFSQFLANCCYWPFLCFREQKTFNLNATAFCNKIKFKLHWNGNEYEFNSLNKKLCFKNIKIFNCLKNSKNNKKTFQIF